MDVSESNVSFARDTKVTGFKIADDGIIKRETAATQMHKVPMNTFA